MPIDSTDDALPTFEQGWLICQCTERAHPPKQSKLQGSKADCADLEEAMKGALAGR
ncbi:MAG TPA: hypothetical protein V6C63_15315 [Allocoleopsis sp.]